MEHSVIAQTGRTAAMASDSRLAIVDIGSNSIRLVIFDTGRGRLGQHLLNEKALCQLGQAVAATGRIEGQPWLNAQASLKRMAALIAASGVSRVRVVATAAVRAATNADEIIAQIAGWFGCALEVLPGPLEAQLAAKGVALSIPGASGIVADLGGGSLELSRLTVKGAVREALSVPCGTLALQAAISGFTGSRLEAVRAVLDGHLANLPQATRLKGQTLYCVGGSWRALAAFHMHRTAYPLSVVHRYSLRAAKLQRLLRQVARWDDERLARASLSQSKRRSTFREACILLHLLIERYGITRVVFSAAGVREGLLLDSLQREGWNPLKENLEFNAVRALLFGGDRFEPMGPALIDWTRALHNPEVISANLWEAACWLSDFGWARHPSYKASETASLVLRSNYLPHDHEARAFLSSVVYRRYGGFSLAAVNNDFRQLMSHGVRRQARTLGGALRIAYTLCQGVPEMLQGTSLTWVAKGYLLQVPAAWAEQAIDGLDEALSFFEDLTNLPIEVRYQ